jgi:hypothetical protein
MLPPLVFPGFSNAFKFTKSADFHIFDKMLFAIKNFNNHCLKLKENRVVITKE